MKPLKDVLTAVNPEIVDSPMTLPRNLTGLRNYLRCLTKAGGEEALRRGYYIADLGTGPQRQVSMMKGCCPCLTRSRAGAAGYWSFAHRRPISVGEMLALQGVPKARLRTAATVTDCQLREMVGNSMDVQLLARIFCRLFRVLGVPGVTDPVVQCRRE